MKKGEEDLAHSILFPDWLSHTCNTPSKFVIFFFFHRPQSLTLFLRLVIEPETTKPPTFRRSSPIRKPAVHPVVNRQLSVSQTDTRSPFHVNRLSFSFCVSIAFSTSAAPRHSSVCLFYRLLPRSILCHFCVSIAPFSTAAAPRHLVTFCVSKARFQLR